MPDKKKIAIVLDPTSARRLAPGMFPCFKPNKVFWLLDALRPAAEIVEQLERWQPDGIVMRVHPETNHVVLRLGRPTVICGGNRALTGVTSVSADNEKVGEEAARHLLALGLQSIGFFGVNAPFSPQRERGFVARIRAAGIVSSVHIDERPGWEHYMEMLDGADAELTAWLQQLPKPAGVFAAHDPLGWRLTQACRMAGIAVPEDVAVVGANNDELVCGLSSPPLSSVALPWKRIGAEAAVEIDRMLAAASDNAPLNGRYIRIAPEGIVTRQSTDVLAVDSRELRRALRFIQEHASEPITVATVTRAVAVSRRKLEQEFTRHLHRTPKEELTRVRVERAKVLLAETSLAIPIVAERCGYNYAERFTVAFRKTVGSTPSGFRKSMRPATAP